MDMMGHGAVPDGMAAGSRLFQYYIMYYLFFNF